jgi:ketosteroid isomerase-like protein
MEFPFAAGDSPRRLEGREAVASYLAGYPDLLQIEEVTSWVDHGEVIEFALRGTVVATGDPYELSYVAVLTVDDDRIRHYRDYWNPVVAAEVLQGEVLR